MCYISVIVFSVLISGVWCSVIGTFPPWFLFGAGSSAYQVEGAWNVSDKGMGIWDEVARSSPHLIEDGSNGDVACDSYHLWRRDIEMAVELGLDMYRFSIAWPRLLPNGFSNHISEDGKNYYNNLIDGLLEKGIQPAVTLYHYDLPQTLQDLGGWTNPLIADWFADYARVVFSLYADRVKLWFTINEPLGVCDVVYNGMFAPHIVSQMGQYMCSKNVLIAHAKAWRIYDEEYKPRYHGKVSIVSVMHWFRPVTPDDAETAELTFEYMEGRFSHPIYSERGGWSPRIERLIAENSRNEGYTASKLPAFTEEEINLVRGTYDFYAFNFYSALSARKAKPGEEIGAWPFDGASELNVKVGSSADCTETELIWITICPNALYDVLTWLNKTYNGVEILITENGYPGLEARLDDVKRVEHMQIHLEQILRAVNDGIPVTGYTAWCMMDNFEWLSGYSVKFGLYAVDFSDLNRMRTPRDSAKYYAAVTRSHSLNPSASTGVKLNK